MIRNSRKGLLALNIALWSGQILLALLFGMIGSMKLTTPLATLVQSLPSLAGMPEGLIRLIGLSELAGALGLILPAATRILPLLTPLAGLGLTTVMVLAAAFHLMRGEMAGLAMPLLLGSISLLISWGRYRWLPIEKR
ncbi:hypothetical protein COW36_14420 [bacterium (Candidatus Blackallbacteria) CG17_big_fil_post_rev_8_21_14_2_50_48_46]|uniref:DoxX family protein n=1 Tax=bacterium (Candidatus Blackallbacteria) CG17_big_fil_post_rev_8_21_14_2_50_48_46 TaxID=2014261 RepID=A0A2M7G393_9BACT|nr:MAG: hypothetical protein COW64_08945 [bacterium (Candidatus Blackallbacteria) CG18_big_fil_WC_8_21_14_2_50_49_26]PIW16155.1 MAG: hypothetical protein COW36_14420 [bacterium (Candidatus Blackallbacteria) CG17_big_fil_post_rev_8_21_14_2_50_48_46]PIW44242.1 MAG: hypothetical protein COW20_24750 [bacterium (Candidatus Blackallbacteria) CG13_big_fil_rev_8_21_14_2_50_49_14]